MRILWRYLAVEYLRAALASLAAICAIVLVVDFVDHAKGYTGPGWQLVALRLYGYKAIVFAYQFAPAALLLAAGVCLAAVRRRGEVTALRALAVGPEHLLGPIAAVAIVAAAGLFLADEHLVGVASRRIDEISFASWGDWRASWGQTRWFKGRRTLFHLRAGDAEEGFSDVTLYELSDGFRLARRLDARQMVHLGGRRWRLSDVEERSLDRPDVSAVAVDAAREVDLEEEPLAFRVMTGRPEQQGFGDLAEQIRLRGQVGLPVERHALALHGKLTHPLIALPGALFAGALALRPRGRGQLSAAIAEGFATVVGLWSLLVAFRAAALGGTLSPAAATWAPVAAMALACAVAVRRLAR